MIDKKHREEETKKIIAIGIEPGSPGRFDAIRLNNTTVRSLKEVGNKTVALNNQGIQSPTNILSGAASPSAVKFF